MNSEIDPKNQNNPNKSSPKSSDAIDKKRTERDARAFQSNQRSNQTQESKKSNQGKGSEQSKYSNQPQTKAELEKIINQQALEIKKQKEFNLKLKDANMDLLVEMESLRKRTEREMDKVANFSNENLIKELLPLIDSLELGKAQQNATSEDLKIGIQMSLDMLLKVLEKNKVSFINPAINTKLDPQLHEAITLVPSKDIKHNHILDVMQKGVILNDRLVRSAKVIVAENNN